jgi:hypothetical protein
LYTDLYVLALRRTLEDKVTSNKDAQTKILANKFFLGRGEILQPDPYTYSMLTRGALIS